MLIAASTSATDTALLPGQSWPVPARGNTLDDRLTRSGGRKLAAKELVFAEGDPVTHIYRIETGVVCLFRVTCDGRRQVVGFAFPGDFLGLGSPGSHVVDAQAITLCRLQSLPVAAVRDLARRDPDFSVKLYEAISDELASIRDLLFTTGQRSAAERVAAFLMAQSERNRRNSVDPREIELPMTRGDIADFLGLTIETVSRTLTKFRGLRLIDLPHRSRARICDLAQLERIANGAVEV
jgi:CRP/FNR family transcriptional regulator